VPVLLHFLSGALYESLTNSSGVSNMWSTGRLKLSQSAADSLTFSSWSQHV